MENIDLESICRHLVALAKEAGDIIRNAKPSTQSILSKKNTADIVTKTDKAIEALLHDRLTTKYPDFAFIGEETYHPGVIVTNQPTFIVDPIDGTSNFVHGFPEVCVSIGLVVEKRPKVGVVYNPFHRELWSAVDGRGAFTTRDDGPAIRLPLAPGPPLDLESACIGIEWGSDREGPNFELNLKVFTGLARTARSGGRFVNSLRCTGSAAIAICRVAAGQQDAFWECGSWAWDVSAAWCILAEAGGRMVDGHPGGWDIPVDNRRYLAVRPATNGQEGFIQDFWSVIGDERSTYGPLGC